MSLASITNFGIPQYTIVHGKEIHTPLVSVTDMSDTTLYSLPTAAPVDNGSVMVINANGSSGWENATALGNPNAILNTQIGSMTANQIIVADGSSHTNVHPENLVAGSGISITNDGSSIMITNTGGGSGDVALQQAIGVPPEGTFISPPMVITGDPTVQILAPLNMAPNQTVTVNDNTTSTQFSQNDGWTYLQNSTGANGLYTNQSIDNDYFELDNIGNYYQWSTASSVNLTQNIDGSGFLQQTGCNAYVHDQDVVVNNGNGFVCNDHTNTLSSRVSTNLSGTLELSANNEIALLNPTNIFSNPLKLHGDSVMSIQCDNSSGIGQISGCPSYSFDNDVALNNARLILNNADTSNFTQTLSGGVSNYSGCQYYFDGLITAATGLNSDSNVQVLAGSTLSVSSVDNSAIVLQAFDTGLGQISAPSLQLKSSTVELICASDITKTGNVSLQPSGIMDFANATEYNFDQPLFSQSDLVQTTINGSTSSRPVSPYLGQMYFDTALGYPIVHDGIQWINFLGVPV
jgi:hypothetical protein